MSDDTTTAMAGLLVLECSVCGVLIAQNVSSDRKLKQWHRYGRICPRCILKAWRLDREKKIG